MSPTQNVTAKRDPNNSAFVLDLFVFLCWSFCLIIIIIIIIKEQIKVT